MSGRVGSLITAFLPGRGVGRSRWEESDPHNTADLAIDATTLAPTFRRTTPYGETRGTPPATWLGTRGFVNGIQDPTTALTQLGARPYDATLGRFVAADPVIELADPQQWNPYAYSNNNPTTFSDPSGLTSRDAGYFPKNEPANFEASHPQESAPVAPMDNGGNTILDAQVPGLEERKSSSRYYYDHHYAAQQNNLLYILGEYGPTVVDEFPVPGGTKNPKNEGKESGFVDIVKIDDPAWTAGNPLAVMYFWEVKFYGARGSIDSDLNIYVPAAKAAGYKNATRGPSVAGGQELVWPDPYGNPNVVLVTRSAGKGDSTIPLGGITWRIRYKREGDDEQIGRNMAMAAKGSDILNHRVPSSPTAPSADKGPGVPWVPPVSPLQPAPEPVPMEPLPILP